MSCNEVIFQLLLVILPHFFFRFFFLSVTGRSQKSGHNRFYLASAYRARYCCTMSVCPSVCPSHRGIVSNRMHVSNFFDLQEGASPKFIRASPPLQNSTGNSSARALITRGGYVGTFCEFRPKSPFILETVLDRPIVSTDH